MSKRYLQWGYDSFKDTKTGEISDNYIHILNKQAEQIAELEEQLKNATNVNCVKCPHYHITVREENNTTIKSYDCKLGGSILTSGCPLKELKGE